MRPADKRDAGRQAQILRRFLWRQPFPCDRDVIGGHERVVQLSDTGESPLDRLTLPIPIARPSTEQAEYGSKVPTAGAGLPIALHAPRDLQEEAQRGDLRVHLRRLAAHSTRASSSGASSCTCCRRASIAPWLK
jgi:hypothetical protein